MLFLYKTCSQNITKINPIYIPMMVLVQTVPVPKQTSFTDKKWSIEPIIVWQGIHFGHLLNTFLFTDDFLDPLLPKWLRYKKLN